MQDTQLNILETQWVKRRRTGFSDEAGAKLNFGDLVCHADPSADPYLVDPEAAADDDESDVDDLTIRDNDNLILVGHVQDAMAILEVYGERKRVDSKLTC